MLNKMLSVAIKQIYSNAMLFDYINDARSSIFLNAPKSNMMFPEATTDRLQRCVLIIAIALSAVQETMSLSVRERKSEYDICRHPDCERIAYALLNYGNFSVHPCTDFYTYSCGRFLSMHNVTTLSTGYSYTGMLGIRIPYQIKELLEEDVTDSDGIMEKKAKAFHSFCMDTAGADRRGVNLLLSLINSVGNWPMLKGVSNFNENEANWIDVHTYFHRVCGTGALINVMVYGEYFTDNVPRIHIDQPSTIFGKYPKITSDDVPAYKNFIKDLIHYLAPSSGASIKEEELNESVNDVMNFREEIVNIMSWGSVRRHEGRKNNQHTFKSWQTLTDKKAALTKHNNINWLAFVNDTFGNDIPSQNLRDIIVSEPNYLIDLMELISKTRKRTILDHIYLHFVEKHMKYTTKTMRDMANYLNEQITGKSYVPQRWRICLAQNPMPHVVARMYTRKYLDEETLNIVRDMAEDIRLVLLTQVTDATWIDMKTKERISRKLRKLNIIVGYPEFYDDEVLMEAYYENQTIDPDILLNILENEKSEFKMKVLTLLGKTFEIQNNELPTDVYMFYDIQKNALQINAALLQWPYYTQNLPDMVNYATLGSLIGHEMSHAFDNIGRYIDENGVSANWWAPASYEMYQKKVDCLIKQYDHYSVKTKDGKVLHINGHKTVLENFADAVGMRAALVAFTKKNKLALDVAPRLPGLTQYTGTEMFFFASAHIMCVNMNPTSISSFIRNEERCLPRFRVNGPMSNMHEFSESFLCGPQTPMNPSKKCNLWNM